MSSSRIDVTVTDHLRPGATSKIGSIYRLDPVDAILYGEHGHKVSFSMVNVGPGIWENAYCRVKEIVVPCPLSLKTDNVASQAFKADAGKPRFELLMDGCPDALLDVVKVLTWAVQEKKDAPWPAGGKGYVPHSWQEVPEAKRRYRAALQRHENAIARGELNDPESGLPHRAHVATNALFLAQLDYIKE